MSNIYRKNNLARNLKKMKNCLPDLFDFFPKTWLLPLEGNQLISELKKNNIFQKRRYRTVKDINGHTVTPLGK